MAYEGYHNKRLEKLTYKNLNRSEAEITLLRGILAQIYYVLKDRNCNRRCGGIDNVILNIESVCPDVKNHM